MRLFVLVMAGLMSAGCASIKFTALDDHQYRIAKMSDLCAIGSQDTVKRELWMEATKLCAMRREAPVEIEADSEQGIPYVRCTSAWLTFKCEPAEKFAPESRR